MFQITENATGQADSSPVSLTSVTTATLSGGLNVLQTREDDYSGERDTNTASLNQGADVAAHQTSAHTRQRPGDLPQSHPLLPADAGNVSLSASTSDSATKQYSPDVGLIDELMTDVAFADGV